MLNNRIGSVTMLGAMLSAVLSAAVPAQAIDWLTPNSNGFYDEGVNWVGGVAPGFGDSVRFDTVGNVIVTWDDITGNTESDWISVSGSNVTFRASSSVSRTHSAFDNVSVQSGSTLTLDKVATGDMILNIDGSLTVSNDSTFNINSGSDVNVQMRSINVYNNAVFNVDGTGSSVDNQGSVVSITSTPGLAAATMNFMNDSRGSFGAARLAAGTALFPGMQGAEGYLNVTGGSQVFVSSSFNIGNDGLSGQMAAVLVDGPGSRISQDPIIGSLEVGAASNSTGMLTISNSGLYEGGFTSSVRATGTLNINTSATFVGENLTIHGTANVATDGRIFADHLSRSGGGSLTTDNTSIISVNTMSGFGPAANFNGYVTFGEPNGAASGSHTVAAGESFTVGRILAIGQNKPATLSVDGSVNANVLRIGTSGPAAGSVVNVNMLGSVSTTSHLRVGGSFAGLGGASTLTVDGGGVVAYVEVGGTLQVFPGSTVNVQSGGRVGDGSNVNADIDGTVNVNTGGRFLGRTVNLNAGGAVNLASGGLFFADILAINGGTFDDDSNTRLTVNVMDQIGVLTLLGGLEIGSADAGSSLSNVTIDSGERINMTGGGDAVIGGFASSGHLTINNGGRFDSFGNVRLGSYEVPGSTLDVNAGGVMSLLGSLTVTGNTVGVPGTPASTLNINGGTVEAGSFTFDEGTIVNINSGGLLQAAGPIDVPGGTLNVNAGGNISLFMTGTLTATNSAQLNFVDHYTLGDLNNIFVTDGSDMHTDGALIVTDAAVFVDGPGSSLTTNLVDTATVSRVGGSGDGGELHFGNNATGTINSELFQTGDAMVTVWSGADLNTKSIEINAALFAASMNVEGNGSTLTMAPGSTLEIGTKWGGLASFGVGPGGTANTGPGMTILGANGTIGVNDGLIQIGGGPLSGNFGDIEVTPGGILKGIGTIDIGIPGFLTNRGGTIAPGLSIGTLAVNATGGGFASINGTGAVLEIEINGVGVAGIDYDLLDINGSAKAGGTLDLVLGPGYMPTLGDEFDFLSAGDGLDSGVFEAVTNVVQAGNLGLAVRYPSFGFEIDMRVSIRGDTDFDDDVDTGDLTTAIIEFNGAGGNGNSWVDGDFDGDGDTDTGDLTVGIINFTGASAANPNVPDLVYDPATGNVTIDADGADVISFSLQAGPFNAADFSELPAGLTDNIASQIGWTSFNLFSGLTGSADLSAILPAGLDQAGLEAALTTASYGLALSGGGGGGRLDIIIPEPGSVVLMLIAGTTLFRRRRLA